MKDQFIIITICIALFSSQSLEAQKLIIKSSDTQTLWYNFEEWVAHNTNLGFRTLDFGSFETYVPDYTYGINKNISYRINGLLYHSSWLSNDQLTIPNFNFSEIDSVIITQNHTSWGISEATGYQIDIFTKTNESYISFEEGRLNQINDPGILFDTPNVEFVNFPTNISSTFKYKNYTTNINYSSEFYSRTNRLIYNRKEESTLYNRTLPFEEGRFVQTQRNSQSNFTLFKSFTTDLFDFELLFASYRSFKFYEWYKLAGIEIPYMLSQNQLSLNFENRNSVFYKGSQISYSETTSDSLEEFSGPLNILLTEKNFSHTSLFQTSSKDKKVNLSISNHIYSIKDLITNKEISHHSYSFKFYRYDNFIIELGNNRAFINYKYFLNDYININFQTLNQKINKNNYNFSLFNKNIGFSELDKSKYMVENISNFRNTFSKVYISLNRKFNSSKFYQKISIKHYWNLTNEIIDYKLNESQLQLVGLITYKDSKHEGFLGFNTNHEIELINDLFLKTNLSANLLLYGSKDFRNHYKSIQNILISESIKWNIDKNFILELVYKFIPRKRFLEYENIQNSNMWPPINSKPISLLNLSSSMKFFKERFDLKFTLRNLLNTTEAYDTNGMYYNMSIYISGKISLKY